MRTLLATAVNDWFRHRSARLGAALAYYSVFSLGPLLLIVTSLAGVVFGHDAVQGALTGQFKQLLGPNGSQALDAMLEGAAVDTQGYLTAASGIVLLVAAALGVVVQLKDALNTIWEVTEPEHQGMWGYLQTYLVSTAGILGLGFLLAVSLVISTSLTAMSVWIGGTIAAGIFWEAINVAISFAILSVLFAMMFRWFPDVDVDWADVWPGAITSALLFNLGKVAISWYIGTQGLESTYGAAASIVALLIWIYYSAQIVLFGAEVSHANWRMRRRRVSEQAASAAR